MFSNGPSERRVVITGLGAISPLGHDVKNLWDGLLQGRSATGIVTRFDPSDFPAKVVAEIKDYDPTDYFDRKEARRMDLSHQYALIAAREAMNDAGLKGEDCNPERAGVIIGHHCGGVSTLTENYDTMKTKGPRRISPSNIAMIFSDMAPALISMEYGFLGVNYTTVSACASGAHAIIDAHKAIRDNEANVVIAGGTDAPIVPLAFGGFCAMKVISTSYEEPEKVSRPFDAKRDGFVLAEGAGIMVMESLEHAKKRGAKILAELIGYGMSADAYHIVAPDPEGKGAALAMKCALESANVKPADVDYINTHGTSTVAGDKAETSAIKSILGEDAYRITINSSKSMIGHLIGGAGGIEALITILTINSGKIHPTINYEYPDPDCDLDYSANKITERNVDIAISNSFGFGGHNTALVLKKFRG
ncbi:MAG: beta-ketoacyl-ACP synthase II [candidate division Zixibacteria bacterium]|nr:beta-ketoacyl-ACP synthase II [candidate division Zixibacteria bacterium]